MERNNADFGSRVELATPTLCDVAFAWGREGRMCESVAHWRRKAGFGGELGVKETPGGAELYKAQGRATPSLTRVQTSLYLAPGLVCSRFLCG